MSLLSSTTKSVLLLSTAAMAVLLIAFLVLAALRAKREDNDLTLRAIGAGTAILTTLLVGVSAALDLGTSLKPDLSNFFSWVDQSFASQGPSMPMFVTFAVVITLISLRKQVSEIIRRG